MMLDNSTLDKEKVFQMLTDLESEQIERTISITDTNKLAQAVCAFSNDLSNTTKNGYLLIGVRDKGQLSGLKATDNILQLLGGLRSDGNILPQPIMSVQSFSLEKGDVVVIEVQPSPFPPVRYKGKTWIRVGARKAVANEMEERILIERRSANVSMFDIRPSIDTSLEDMDLELFRNKYLPNAIDSELLKNDKRDIKEQLAALRFYNTKFNCPTNAGILLFGNDPEYFIPGAYVQFVKFKGKTLAGEILNEKKFSGNLMSLLPRIDVFIDDALITQRPVPVSTLQEKTVRNYPNWAVRELMMNAIMHRDYESNAPIKFYQFDDRLEIGNAGGLYGKARPENFPYENDYRNPTLAETMKVLGYVNRFNRGISRVQEELKENGNIQAVFKYDNPGTFGVTVNDALFNAGIDTTDIDKSAKEAKVKSWVKTKQKLGERLGERLGENEWKILEVVYHDTSVSIVKMAELLSISTTAIENNIKKLKEKKILIRQGSAKGGFWKILE